MTEQSTEFNSSRLNIQIQLKLGQKYRFENENDTILEEQNSLYQMLNNRRKGRIERWIQLDSIEDSNSTDTGAKLSIWMWKYHNFRGTKYS